MSEQQLENNFGNSEKKDNRNLKIFGTILFKKKIDKSR